MTADMDNLNEQNVVLIQNNPTPCPIPKQAHIVKYSICMNIRCNSNTVLAAGVSLMSPIKMLLYV